MMRFDPNGADWPSSRRRGISVLPLWVDEKSGDAAVLVRMEPGCEYPRHRHVREEDVFVLQGGFRDSSGSVHGRGELVRMPRGSSHVADQEIERDP